MTTPRFLLRVLIVTDNDEDRARVRALLQKMGISFTQTATGDTALGTTTEMKPDLVLIDIAGATALRTVKELRRSGDQRVARTPILLLTDTRDRAFIETARDLGVDAMLLKPVISTMLRQRIDAITSDLRRFVRNTTYVGPCRRRREDDTYGGPQRRRTVQPRA